MHTSLPVSGCEFLNIEGFSPLISKCQIKVLYSQDTPNRKDTLIDDAAALKLARGLRGSPIVGFYVKEKEDFDEHTKELSFDKNGNFEIKELTRPYGFVDINADIWFQEHLDDDGEIRKYLMTNGYIWTTAYPEAQRIISKGNNQSMEINKESLQGFWAKDKNLYERFFIINDGIIEKLCILGEDVEPCFEGAQINCFSLDDNFKNTLFQMAKELKQVLSEGGQSMEKENKGLEEQIVNYACGGDNAADDDEKKKKALTENAAKNKEEEKKESPAEEEKEEKPTEEKEVPEEEKKPEKKSNYSLEEVVEYSELLEKYNLLSSEFDTLKVNYSNLETQNKVLLGFKEQVDLKDKQNMIDSFTMLSDEDKADVIKNIKEYSLDEIEAKLSVICFRNKVSFATLEETDETNKNTSFNLSTEDLDDTPAWLKAVEKRKQNY